MERYKIIKSVGDGAFGTVFKATNVSTGEVVAIKKMKKKFYNWEECLALREIKSLRKLSHANLIKLKEVIRSNDELHLVFEYLDQNIYQQLQAKPLTEVQVKSMMSQCFQGLAYLHKHGFFHRDLKPENILAHGEICKIADFGLAREIRSRPPFTDYVSTRWYRAPEIVLRGTNYNSPVDLFAMGCIMVELYTQKPLFPGNNETDQILKLCSVLGTPSHSDWPEGFRLASAMNFRFPNCQPQSFNLIVQGASPEAIDLISKLLRWDPAKRPSATDCLNHPYFSENPGNPNTSSAARRTSSKWSQGSGRVTGNSSKGRLNIKSPPDNSKPAGFLPVLRDIPEVPRPLPQMPALMQRNQSPYDKKYVFPHRSPEQRNRGRSEFKMGMGNIGGSIVGNRVPGMQRGSILPSINRNRFK